MRSLTTIACGNAPTHACSRTQADSKYIFVFQHVLHKMSKLYVISVTEPGDVAPCQIYFSHAIIVLFFPAKPGILRIYDIHNGEKSLTLKIVTQIANTTLNNSLRGKNSNYSYLI